MITGCRNCLTAANSAIIVDFGIDKMVHMINLKNIFQCQTRVITISQLDVMQIMNHKMIVINDCARCQRERQTHLQRQRGSFQDVVVYERPAIFGKPEHIYDMPDAAAM